MLGKTDKEPRHEDLESVEVRIQFTRDDYRLLTTKIRHYEHERSRLETVLRKLRAEADRIKNWRVGEEI